MKNRFWAGALAVTLLASGGVVASTQAAEAHTGAVNGTAICEVDGTVTIDWTFNALEVADGVEAEVKAMNTSQGTLAPIDGVLKGDQVFLSVWSDHQINNPGVPVKTGNWSAQYKSVGIAGDFVGKVTSMVQYDYTNGDSDDPVGEVVLDGTCEPPEEPPVIVPPKPADIVTDVSKETFDCDTKVVRTTVTHTVIGTELVNNVWVPTAPVVTTSFTERPATPQECPVVIPPEKPEPPVVVPPTETHQPTPTPTATSTPAPVLPTSDTLAVTGGDANWILPVIIVGGVIIGGGGWLVVMAYRRRPKDPTWAD